MDDAKFIEAGLRSMCFVCQKRRQFFCQGYDIGSMRTWRCERYLVGYHGEWVCSIDCLHKLVKQARRALKNQRHARQSQVRRKRFSQTSDNTR